MINDRARLRPATSYRDWQGGLFMTALCAITSAFLGFVLVDALQIFPNPAKTHVWLLLKSLAGFDEQRLYFHYLRENFSSAIMFYTIPSAMMIAGGWYAWLWFGRLINPEIHKSGRKVLRGKEAAIASVKATSENVKFSGLGLKVHPDLQFARHQELTSFMFLAGQRGGKTQILSRCLVPAWERGDKTIIFDIVKDDFTQITPPSKNGVEPVIFGPWDSRSAVIDIGKDIRTVQDARAFVAGVIPMSGDNEMWPRAARGGLIAIILKLIHDHGTDWGWKELSDLSFLSNEEMKLIADEHYPPARRSVEDAESKTTQSIMINMNSFLEPIFDLANAWGDLPKSRRFSLTAWLNDENTKYRNLVIQGNTAQQQLSQAYIKAILELLVARIGSPSFPQSSERRIWFVLDEVIQLGKMDCLPKIPETFASRGCSLIIALQSIKQAQEVYGNNIADVFNSTLQTKFFGKITGGSEQRYVLDQLQKKQVFRPNKTISGDGSGRINVSSSYQVEDVDVMQPIELEKLGAGSRGRGGKETKATDKFIRAMVLGHGQDALIFEWPLFIHKKYRPGHVPVKNGTPIPVPITKIHPGTDFHEIKDSLVLASQALTKQQDSETIATTDTQQSIQAHELLILDSMTTQQSHQMHDEDSAAEEVASSIAEDASEEVISEVVGIPSAVIDTLDMLSQIDESQSISDSSKEAITVLSSRMKRKVRTYKTEAEIS